jgi:hypothetical protein
MEKTDRMCCVKCAFGIFAKVITNLKSRGMNSMNAPEVLGSADVYLTSFTHQQIPLSEGRAVTAWKSSTSLTKVSRCFSENK